MNATELSYTIMAELKDYKGINLIDSTEANNGKEHFLKFELPSKEEAIIYIKIV